jgi:hypothetical protein
MLECEEVLKIKVEPIQLTAVISMCVMEVNDRLLPDC